MSEPLGGESRPSIPTRCVECGAALVSPIVCLACPDLRPPKQELDHFARLGMERRYDISLDELERRYLLLARGLHPDQFAQRSAEERAIAEQVSAQLNDSYRALRDPLRRAEYLLALEGGPDRETDKRTPPDFLVEMLELNEVLEEAKTAIDAGSITDAARKDLDRSMRDVERRVADVTATLPEAFRQLTAASGDPGARQAAFSAIRERLNVAAYLQGLLAQSRELQLR